MVKAVYTKMCKPLFYLQKKDRVMNKKKYIAALIIILTLGAVLFVCKMPVEEQTEEEKKEEIIIKKETVSADEYYGNAPHSIIAETPKLPVIIKKETTINKENNNKEKNEIKETQETDKKEQKKEIVVETPQLEEEQKQITGDVVYEEPIEYVVETVPETNYGWNETWSANGTKMWWVALKSEPQLVLSSGGVNGKERPTSVSARTGAAYVINGGEWWGNGTACGVTGIGDTIYQAQYDGENGDTLVLKQDGQLDSVYMTEEEYYRIKPKWAVKGFVPIINGGQRTGYDHARQPRTFIGQDWNGTYYIGVSGGRGVNGTGLTYNELYDFAVGQMSSDLRFLYAMDGGGSSALVCNGQLVNTPTDGSERAVANCIVFY